MSAAVDRESLAPPTAPPPAPGLLLGTQLAFNVGFYAVVPFLALVLREDHLLGGAAIGLVLGLRTFAQQGLFLAGGMLCDRFGARRLILLGCAVRVLGFLLLGLAPGLGALVLGALLTGLGGALFSPAVDTLVAAAEERRPPGAPDRPSLFARLAVVGELGAVLGPAVGAALLGHGFAVVALSAAALFAVIGVVLAALLPTNRRRAAGTPAVPDRAAAAAGVLRHRAFVVFAALHAINLLAWNQLYLGLPVEIARVGAGPGALAAVLGAASALTIVAQLPVARLARRAGAARALPAGYALLAGGFVVLAGAAPIAPPAAAPTAVVITPAGVAVALLVLGHLVAGPVALDLVARVAPVERRGAYFGLLASTGGMAVLVLGVPLGALYDLAEQARPAAALPWAAVGALAAAAAVAMALLLRRGHLPTAGPALHPDHPDPDDPDPDHPDPRGSEIP